MSTMIRDTLFVPSDVSMTLPPNQTLRDGELVYVPNQRVSTNISLGLLKRIDAIAIRTQSNRAAVIRAILEEWAKGQ